MNICLSSKQEMLSSVQQKIIAWIDFVFQLFIFIIFLADFSR